MRKHHNSMEFQINLFLACPSSRCIPDVPIYYNSRIESDFLYLFQFFYYTLSIFQTFFLCFIFAHTNKFSSASVYALHLAFTRQKTVFTHRKRRLHAKNECSFTLFTVLVHCIWHFHAKRNKEAIHLPTAFTRQKLSVISLLSVFTHCMRAYCTNTECFHTLILL